MERLRKLIKEVLSTPPKQDSCNCGCHSCENVGNPGVVLNESIVKKDILSENLRYHVDNKLPLTENTFRYGSEAFLNLWAEARALYLREIIHVNEDDKQILEETDLGNYGIYKGVKVPLDLPMLEEAIIKGDFVIVNDEGKYLKNYRKGGKGSTHYSPTPLEWTSNKNEAIVFGTKGSASNIIRMLPSQTQKKLNIKALEVVNESSKKKKKINKPMRSSSRGKAYKVYVKDPKTKKIKTVRFGSGGLKAKINNPKARQAFAKRHNCAQKTDKTKASYWSCRLPRYAKLLGLKSSFSGFW
jgi:hypothetical protein